MPQYLPDLHCGPNMAPSTLHKIVVIDSHTGGEPTRVVMEGAPTLHGASLSDMRDDFMRNQSHFRASVINEPRGSDIIVGALVLPPVNAGSTASVIFFNNVGVLNMCGHGTIGLIRTMWYTKSIEPGVHRIDTPAGTVETMLHSSGDITVRNVAAYRYKHNVTLRLQNGQTVSGDVAWGGNWFYLCHDHGIPLHLGNLSQLQQFSWEIRRQLEANGIAGADGAEIDHIELTGPAHSAHNNGRNFVLCPGGAYDRSPCGTGTSAKIACLAADGKLRPGETWQQESITGSVFAGSFELVGEVVIPSITGNAFITAEINLVFESADPLMNGITTPTSMS